MDGFAWAPKQREHAKKFCRDENDCSDNWICELDAFDPIADIGICGCTDEDNDQSCVPHDCDGQDENAFPENAFPGNPEVCGEAVDNDCDPMTPDDCSAGGSAGTGSGGSSGRDRSGSGGSGGSETGGSGTGTAGSAAPGGATTPGGVAGTDHDGGCGCRTLKSSAGASPWWFLGAASLLLCRRERERLRSSPVSNQTSLYVLTIAFGI